jgi:hypothetical protein
MAAERTNSTFALLTSGVAFVNSLSMMSLTPIFDYVCVNIILYTSRVSLMNFFSDALSQFFSSQITRASHTLTHIKRQ